MRLALPILLALAATPPAAPARTAGEPVPEGATLSVTAEKREVLLGEPVVVRLRLTNAGPHPFHIVPMTWQRSAVRDEFVRVGMTDPDGRPAWDPFPENRAGGGPAPDGVTLDPGESWDEDLDLWRYRVPDRAGTWRITVTREFGWKGTPARPNPAAEMALAFREPKLEEAGRVLDAIEARGRSARFYAACYPIYVPLLEKRAAAGRAEAAEGLALNRDPEATRALLRLFASPDLAVAEAAGRHLVNRVRVPVSEGDDEGRRYRRLPSGFLHAEEDFVPAWRASFEAEARAAARAFLSGDGLPVAGAAAEVLALLGIPEDGPALAAAFGHLAAVFETPGPWDSEIAQYLVKHAEREEEALSHACGRLFRRGLRPPGGSLEAGDSLLWLESLLRREARTHTLEEFRDLERLAAHPRALVRRNTAFEVRSGVAGDGEAGRLLLRRLAEDADGRVRKAARGER